MGDCNIRKQLNVRPKTGVLLSDDRKNIIGGLLKYRLTEHSFLASLGTFEDGHDSTKPPRQSAPLDAAKQVR